jgi:histidinol-phosphate aminotransferase
MRPILEPAVQRDLQDRGFSRRSFGRIAALLAAGAVLPFYNEGALAQVAAPAPAAADGIVKIDANENPMGPCAEALAAAGAMVRQGGRYMMGEAGAFVAALAKAEGLGADHVRAFAGSSPPLHQAVLAFASPTRPFVAAEPGYEAGSAAAAFVGAKVLRVPLTKTFSHDVKAMAAASPDAGVIYVCNPNNPTGTVTPREEIEWLLEHKPRGSVVLLDEAYIHFCQERPCTDLVGQGKDLIVLRTFSKIYGMAGLRAGAALGRPDLLEKLTRFSAGMLPSTGMAAATASLGVAGLIEERRGVVARIREDCLAFLKGRGFTCVPSVSNKFMVDVRKPGGQVAAAMRGENVYIGRVWSSWPTFVRVTVGTEGEMERFKAAFVKVMS